MDPLSGLRRDGRRGDEMRDIRCQFGVAKNADGSVLYEQGNTKILATVFGPSDAVNLGDDEDDDGDMQLLDEPTSVECEFKLSAVSQSDRRGEDPRSEEYGEYMEMCYKTIMFPHKTSQAVVRVVCQVLQNDGSFLAAALTAGGLALIDSGIPIKDLVVGCSATILEERTLADLSAQEEMQRLPQVTVGCLPKTGEVIVVDTMNRFHKDLLKPMLECAVAGCQRTFGEIQLLIREHVRNSASSGLS